MDIPAKHLPEFYLLLGEAYDASEAVDDFDGVDSALTARQTETRQALVAFVLRVGA